MEVIAQTGKRPRRLRTGIASGSTISPSLVKQVKRCMGVGKMLIAYGMTETIPLTFMTGLGDSDEKGATTVGRVMPHTTANVIDKNENILLRGERGELCARGYALQKGYWKSAAQTREVMKRDDNGVLWMHTGDQAMIGGENIFPREIEERLVSHPYISEASVVGIADPRYGEVVTSFLKAVDGVMRPGDQEVRKHVSNTLGQHNKPQYCF
ncbi:hypothetical protein BDV35DRAFT_390105 [Aspergillus flavus]|uniref:AMP-dependent synthetase/ligase domain-containing protein n=1 Tax=Aspergillus flavus TaxID=5059 RepID=A0A5N6H8S3_ASPFL|nr:hypothetical protein BDV35DRAFT_390105 [Aspergillus flavus]